MVALTCIPRLLDCAAAPHWKGVELGACPHRETTERVPSPGTHGLHQLAMAAYICM